MAVGCGVPTIALRRRLCGRGRTRTRPPGRVTRRPRFSRAHVLGRDFIGGDKRRLGRSRRLGRALVSVSETRRRPGAPLHQAGGARARGPSPATTWRHALGIQRPYPTLKHDPKDAPGINTTQPLAPEGAPASALPGFPVLFAMCRMFPDHFWNFADFFQFAQRIPLYRITERTDSGKLWQKGEAHTSEHDATTVPS